MVTFAAFYAVLPITWFLMAVVFGLVVLVRMLSVKDILTLLGVVCGVVVGLMLITRLSYQQQPATVAVVHQAAVAHAPAHTDVIHTGHEQPPTAVSEELPISEMWERLTRPRIELEHATTADELAAEQQAEPTAEHRPDWVDHPPKRVGNVYREVVASERYSSVDECYLALEPELNTAVLRRVGQLTSNTELPTLAELGIGIDEVLRDICHDVWVETVENSFGEMKRVHVLLWFDATVDGRLEHAYRDYHRQSRLLSVGSVAGVIVGSLTILYGLLLADTATRGYYTKRLFFGVPAAIIVLVLLLVV